MRCTPIERTRNAAYAVAAERLAAEPRAAEQMFALLLQEPDLLLRWRRSIVRSALRERMTTIQPPRVHRFGTMSRALVLRHAQATGFWGAGMKGDPDADWGVNYWVWDTRITGAMILAQLEGMGVAIAGERCHTDARDCCGGTEWLPIDLRTYGNRIVVTQRWARDY